MDSNVMESGCGLSLDTSSVCVCIACGNNVKVVTFTGKKGNNWLQTVYFVSGSEANWWIPLPQVPLEGQRTIKKKAHKETDRHFSPLFVFVLQMLASP